MISQKFFNYKFNKIKDEDNFFVNITNKNAYDITILDNFDQNIFLYGPRKSGKSQLVNFWLKKNNAILFKKNFSQIIKTKNNIAIDDALLTNTEEDLFHIINHCKSFNLKLFLTSSIHLNSHIFKLQDLYSRLKELFFLEINNPDDEMCKMLMTKLFIDKQIIIKNKEIFDYILKRVNRSYIDINRFVQKIDNLSLEKKRQLTIPLIKEII